NRLQMVMPDFELIPEEDRSLNMGRIVPVYPLTKGISQRYLRKLVDGCLKEHGGQLAEIIPVDVLRRQGFEEIGKNIRQIHFPANAKELERATARIAFEEFFLFQISVILRRMSIVQKKGIAHHIGATMADLYAKALPFPLTGAQKKVLKEIAADMAK